MKEKKRIKHKQVRQNKNKRIAVVQRLESVRVNAIISPRNPGDSDEERLKLIRNKEWLIQNNKWEGNHKELREYKNKITRLSVIQLEWAVGLLLSDSSLQANKARTAYRLKTQQSEAHLPLLLQKLRVFEEFTNKAVGPYNRKNSIMYEVDTIMHPVFNTLLAYFQAPGSLIKPGGCVEKVVNSAIRDVLTPRTIGVWFCGDGGRRDYGVNQGKAIQFAVHGFDYASIQVLQQCLIEIYGWDVRIRFDYRNSSGREFYLLQLEANSFESFSAQITPYILPVFLQRLPSARRPGSRYANPYNTPITPETTQDEQDENESTGK